MRALVPGNGSFDDNRRMFCYIRASLGLDYKGFEKLFESVVACGAEVLKQ